MNAELKMTAHELLRMLTNRFGLNSGGLIELSHQLHSNKISPCEAAAESIERITRSNARLNCYVTTAKEQAKTQADFLQNSNRQSRKPLWGVPISVKDLTSTSGIRTTYSSKAFASYVPIIDSPLVTRMKESGMIVVGKTNTSEFGALPVTESELNGICRNPWNLDWSVGGSSGGAAASIAAGLTTVAHGSDGAGSVRIPASCCGVFAVLIPRGRLPPSERVCIGAGAQDGVFSRTVADALYYLAGVNAISLEELNLAIDVGSSSSTESIVLSCTAPINCSVDEHCVLAAHRAAEILGNSGCRITTRVFDWGSESLLCDIRLLRSLTPISFGDPAPHLLDDTTRSATKISTEVSAVELQRTYARIYACSQRILNLIGEDEIVLTPATTRPSVRHGWITESNDPDEIFRRSAEFAPFTAFVNLAGLCAVSVPMGWTSNNLPVGIQLATRPNNFAKLLGLASRLESVSPWRQRTPQNYFG